MEIAEQGGSYLERQKKGEGRLHAGMQCGAEDAEGSQHFKQISAGQIASVKDRKKHDMRW